jgi:C1A family cysteine protease
MNHVTRFSSAVFIVVTIFAIELHAQEPQLAPVNPDFFAYLISHQNMTYVPEKTSDGHYLGFIPPPVDLSHTKGMKIFKPFPILGYPPSYDLRAQGKLSAVRDQGACGSCWAFATMASLESYLLPGDPWDFSENNLKNLHGFDKEHCAGGNQYMSAAYFTRWDGPKSDADDPYNPSSNVSPADLVTRKHVQNVYFLPERSGSLDNDSIKDAVTAYGAVSIAMYYDDAYYNAATFSYYYNGTLDTNHLVDIVGWDDNYDKSKFLTAPSGNGAFICRNNWGASWGDSGYFYISYYDSVLSYPVAFNNAGSIGNYSRIYMFDPLGYTSRTGYSSETGWFANIFTAVTDEPLMAVSFFAGSPNSAYEIYIYTGVSSGPASGTLAGSKTGTISLPGYSTVVLDSSVSLSTGQKFSIMVKLTTPALTEPIPLEYPYANYSSKATANAGESFISSNGSSWTDVASLWSNTNVSLKGFAGTPPSVPCSTCFVPQCAP